MKKYLVSLVMMVILVGFTSCENEVVNPDNREQVEVVEDFFPAVSRNGDLLYESLEGESDYDARMNLDGFGRLYLVFKLNSNDEYNLVIREYDVVKIEDKTFIKTNKWSNDGSDNTTQLLVGIRKIDDFEYIIDVNGRNTVLLENSPIESYRVIYNRDDSKI
jgi:hypothetical protein